MKNKIIGICVSAIIVFSLVVAGCNTESGGLLSEDNNAETQGAVSDDEPFNIEDWLPTEASTESELPPETESPTVTEPPATTTAPEIEATVTTVTEVTTKATTTEATTTEATTKATTTEATTKATTTEATTKATTKATTTEATTKATTKATTEKTSSPSKDTVQTYDYDQPKEVTYILNTNTMKFHLPKCSSVDRIKPEHYVEFYGTREEAIAKGYSPCGRCHP